MEHFNRSLPAKIEGVPMKTICALIAFLWIILVGFVSIGFPAVAAQEAQWKKSNRQTDHVHDTGNGFLT
jgi:hypothetical protein